MKNLLLLLVFFYTTSCILSAGSYPYAERYEINLSESNLAGQIELFKNKNLEFSVPSDLGLIDGRGEDKDHWYHIYFNDVKEKKVIYVWIRKKSKFKTTLAFVADIEYSALVNWDWKDINDDYNYSENKKVIKKFEENILYKLGINEFIEN